MEVNGLFTEIF